MVSFGAPQGKRLGRRDEGDAFARPSRGNTADCPAPPEPEGNLPDCELPCAPRARCTTASNPGARHRSPDGEPWGCVLSAAGSAARRRDAGDPLRSSSRGNAADDPRAARTLRACGHCGRIRRREPRPMHNGIESRLATGLRPQAPHAQPQDSPSGLRISSASHRRDATVISDSGH